MNKTRKPLFTILFFTGLSLLIVLLLQPVSLVHFFNYISVIFPAGTIAIKERNLLLIIQAIMLLVVIPVYILTFVFSWKYSAQNPKGKYDPDLVDNKTAEYIWWGVPFVLTAIICVLTWVKTEELDPYKPIKSDKKPLSIQVVALDWKWLFIYPEQEIATVNFIQVPIDTPLDFQITADAPMNSFWIPSLGGQIYAMPNMETKLHLIANKEGEFRGSSANLSGEGFSSMHFMVKATSEAAFEKWIKEAKDSKNSLDLSSYKILAKPSSHHKSEVYTLQDKNLFTTLLHQHMHP